MIEAACHWPWCCPFQSVVKKAKFFLMNKVKDYHQTLFIQLFIKNLLPAKPAKRFSKSC